MVTTASIIVLIVILGISLVVFVRHLRSGAAGSKLRYADRTVAIAIIIGIVLFTLVEQVLRSSSLEITSSSLVLTAGFGAAFIVIGVAAVFNGVRVARLFMRPPLFHSYLQSYGERRLKSGLRGVGLCFVAAGCWLLWLAMRLLP